MSGTAPVPPPPPRSGSGTPRQGDGVSPQTLSVASLILGIISVLLSFVIIGGILGFAGLVIGLMQLSKGADGRGMAIGGVLSSTCGIIATLGVIFLYYIGFQFMAESMGDFADASFDHWEGVRAPELSVTTLDGEVITLAELEGKRVIVYIWATWCPPCRDEIPHFIELAEKHSPDELIIIGISNEDEETLREFAEENGVNYALASMDDAELPAPFSEVTSIPTTFFIDRNGVFQSIVVGYHDYKHLSELALASDYEGEVLDAPPEPQSGLVATSEQLRFEEIARISLSRPVSICTGQWDGEGSEEIAVAEYGGDLKLFGIDGTKIATVSELPLYDSIDMGWHPDQGPRFLGYEGWGHSVYVVDESGRQVWKYRLLMGVNGAHWGDLDGDGADEMIVGGNGAGGLTALSPDGKKLWKETLGNVWNQAIVERPDGATVYATEAGGTVRVFDGQGERIDTLRPNNGYYSTIDALYVPSETMEYVLSIEEGQAVCFNEHGFVVWQTPALGDITSWQEASLTHGDANGDGDPEWLFSETEGQVSIVTVAGARLGSFDAKPGLKGFRIVDNDEGDAVLALLYENELALYRITLDPVEPPLADPEPVDEREEEAPNPG